MNASAFSIIVFQFAELLQQAEHLARIASTELPPQDPVREFGLLIHDNNPTVALKHTGQLRAIRENKISARHGIFDRIIETPLFVDSTLTRMIQLADLWGYSLRRYVENGDTGLFSILYSRQMTMIGRIQHPARRARVDHMADTNCRCLICTNE